MPIKNYTTTISVQKTTNEIQEILGRAGAQAVLTEYDPGERGLVVAVSFKIRVAGDFLVAFRLPARIDGVLLTLKRQKGVPRRFCNREQAARVAWRIIKDWITAQLALVESEIAGLAEVFLPYVEMGDGETLYEKFSSSPGNLLPYNPDA